MSTLSTVLFQHAGLPIPSLLSQLSFQRSSQSCILGHSANAASLEILVLFGIARPAVLGPAIRDLRTRGAIQILFLLIPQVLITEYDTI